MSRDLLGPYVTLLGSHPPVVDLACGAGELLAELDAPASRREVSNVIPNWWRGPGTEACQLRPVTPLAFLEAQPDHSLGAVFSSGVIERLAVSSQWHLLEHALRALRPGGMFIAESLNPHSVSAMNMLAMSEVGQHPVFPEVALGTCGLAGFGRAFMFAPAIPASKRHASRRRASASSPLRPTSQSGATMAFEAMQRLLRSRM